MIEEQNDNSGLSASVYNYVKDMILTMQIKPGEKIPESRIAKELGISRTPIREALRQLSSDGLVNIYPKRFAEVAQFDEEYIKELGEVRLCQDMLAAKLAMFYGSNADFMQLKRIADECFEAAQRGDIINRLKLDCDFHLYLTQISRNKLLMKFQSELYLRVQLIQACRYNGIEDSLQKIEHHNEIVSALMARDEKRLVRCTKAHLVNFYGINEELPADFFKDFE